MDGNTCRLVSLGYTVPATKQILNLLLGLKISWAGAGMSCFALTLTDGGRIARLFTCSSWTFSSFSIRAKNVPWVSSEQSVLWVKLNNSKRSEPAQSSVWRLMLYKRLELVYNVIIWFCNLKVSSPALRALSTEQIGDWRNREDLTTATVTLTLSQHADTRSQASSIFSDL